MPRVSLREQLMALDTAFGMAQPCTPPPWSPEIGPLLPLHQQLNSWQRAHSVAAALLVLGGLVAATLQPVLLALLALAALAALAGGWFLRSRMPLPREIELARDAPGDVPRRHRSWAWPATVGAGVAGASFGICLLLISASEDRGTALIGASSAISVPLAILLMHRTAFRRQLEQVLSWEREHGRQVLVPMGRRSPSRGGYYVARPPVD